MELNELLEKLDAGKVISGQYKNGDRNSTELALEVTDVLVLPTAHGKVAYVFGTRIDAAKAGVISLLRLECFRASKVEVTDAVNFKPIEGYAENEWRVTPHSASFGFFERVAEKDLEWNAEVDGKPMRLFSVKANKTEVAA